MSAAPEAFETLDGARTLAEVEERLAQATALEVSSAQNVRVGSEWRNKFAVEEATLAARLQTLTAAEHDRLQTVRANHAIAVKTVEVAQEVTMSMNAAVHGLSAMRARLVAGGADKIVVLGERRPGAAGARADRPARSST